MTSLSTHLEMYMYGIFLGEESVLQCEQNQAWSCLVLRFFQHFFPALGGGNMYSYAHFSSVAIVELDIYSVRIYLNFGLPRLGPCLINEV